MSRSYEFIPHHFWISSPGEHGKLDKQISIHVSSVPTKLLQRIHELVQCAPQRVWIRTTFKMPELNQFGGHNWRSELSEEAFERHMCLLLVRYKEDCTVIYSYTVLWILHLYTDYAKSFNWCQVYLKSCCAQMHISVCLENSFSLHILSIYFWNPVRISRKHNW